MGPIMGPPGLPTLEPIPAPFPGCIIIGGPLGPAIPGPPLGFGPIIVGGPLPPGPIGWGPPGPIIAGPMLLFIIFGGIAPVPCKKKEKKTSTDSGPETPKIIKRFS